VLIGSGDKFQAEAASVGELVPLAVASSELTTAVGRVIRKALGLRGRAYC